MNLQIEWKQHLTEAEAQQVAALAAYCNKHDGIDLKVEQEWLLNRASDRPRDVLLRGEQNEVLGFIQLFSVVQQVAELNGFVHPDYRRQGHFRQMLRAVATELEVRGTHRAILVADKRSAPGLATVQTLDATYKISEYSMRLSRVPDPVQTHPGLQLREATEADFGFLVRCSSLAFGDPEAITAELLRKTNEPNRKAFVAELEGTPVGMIRQMVFPDFAGIMGFSVLPDQQGKGYGRQILNQLVRQLVDAGYSHIELDVECDNTNALQLYRSCGFAETSAYDYFEVKVAQLR